MKTIFNYYPSFLIAGFIGLILAFNVYGQKKPEIESPVLIDSVANVYEAGDFFLSGQPEKATLDMLKEKGVSMIINVRTKEEMDFHNSQVYDEPEYVKSLSMNYRNIEVGGDAGYTSEAIMEVADAIKSSDGRILIHCRRAGRATLVWMAWLINHNDYSINKAVDLGKEAVFSFPLENLLGYEIKMKPGRKID